MRVTVKVRGMLAQSQSKSGEWVRGTVKVRGMLAQSQSKSGEWVLVLALVERVILHTYILVCMYTVLFKRHQVCVVRPNYVTQLSIFISHSNLDLTMIINTIHFEILSLITLPHNSHISFSTQEAHKFFLASNPASSYLFRLVIQCTTVGEIAPKLFR